ncbi:unnamed protein product [Prunus armeniaca]
MTSHLPFGRLPSEAWKETTRDVIPYLRKAIFGRLPSVGHLRKAIFGRPPSAPP